MRSTPEWFTLEAKDIDRMTVFYDAFLELDVVDEAERETVLAAGDTELRLRAPGSVPRGGLHTHYALTVPEREYDDWYDRLDERFDLVEHSFGDARSLYFYDPEGNCVELGESDVDGDGVTGLFELVLEVEQLDAAVDFYERLGFEIVDDGREEGRVRLTTGEFDLELWSPRLGIADARGGVHVDFGVGADDPGAVAREVADDALSVTSVEEGVRIRDPDGHYVTLVA
ncbi:VOC family protein [Haloarcula salinisoli]|uniref:VOC family protein n=1 Tax=Haloarcula salinisoli TaxID=2487746 RepID=A0A8J7YH13_9EURY|nr:VOC family protein [Halomicroarcula salinisoli]MBX0285249.1 VOC family protein [Halomicroarcula salinisoli]MBX0303273.1 VOC family protein [Halomicroarcula salinisoli]